MAEPGENEAPAPIRDYFARLTALVSESYRGIDSTPRIRDRADADEAKLIRSGVAALEALRAGLAELAPPDTCAHAHSQVLGAMAEEIGILSGMKRLEPVSPEEEERSKELERCLMRGGAACAELGRIAAEHGIQLWTDGPDPNVRMGFIRL